MSYEGLVGLNILILKQAPLDQSFHEWPGSQDKVEEEVSGCVCRVVLAEGEQREGHEAEREEEPDPEPAQDVEESHQAGTLHPSIHLLTDATDREELPLHFEEEELVDEGEEVAAVGAVPGRQEDQGSHLGDSSAAEELEPLVDVD